MKKFLASVFVLVLACTTALAQQVQKPPIPNVAGPTTSAQLGSIMPDVTGSGFYYRQNGALGTPTSGVLTNATGLPISTGVTGLGTGVAAALGVNIGTAGSVVVNGGVLGTPSSGTLTNATGLPLPTGITGILAAANGGTGVNNGSNTITLGGNLTTSGAFNTTLTVTGTTGVTLPTSGTLAALQNNQTWTGYQKFPAGTPPTAAGTNAAGSIAIAFWPNGSRDCVPSISYGPNATGQQQANICYNGLQTAWLNEAWTFSRGTYNAGSLANVATAYPGSMIRGGTAFRWQHYDQDGDFTTPAGLHEYVYSTTAPWFQADVVNGSPTISNFTFDPTKYNFISAAILQGPVYVQLHSNNGTGLQASAKISSLTSTTITLDKTATASLTDADFSLLIIAPAANNPSLGTDFVTYVHRPFTGNITSGSAVISNLKFNAVRMGVPKNGIANGAGIPTDSRVINYSDSALTLGDATTGLTTACTPGSGVAITLNTRNDLLTGTGDVDASCNVTSLSFNPIETGITVGEASYDKPQGGASNYGLTSGVVTAASANSITFDRNATEDATAGDIKINMTRVAIEQRVMGSGVTQRAIKWGWSEGAQKAIVKFENYDLYTGSSLAPIKIIDWTTGTYVGPVNPSSISRLQTPSAGQGETLTYVPLEYAATNLLLRSNDLDNAAWTKSNISSAVASARVDAFGGTTQFTLTSSGTGGYIEQSVSVPADTSSYVGSYYCDTTSVSTDYAVNVRFTSGLSGTITYHKATDTVSLAGDATDGNVLKGPTLADGSSRYRVWVKVPNTSHTTATVRLYVNGSSGAASSVICGTPQLEAVGANTATGPTSYMATAAATASKEAGKINPTFIPFALNAVTTFSAGTTGFTPSSATAGAVTLAGTLIGANGGTGVANTGKTITLGGNLVTSGAFNTTITVTADSNSTFPAGTKTLVPTDVATLSSLTTVSGGTLASAAFKATGTSGNAVPLLDGNNTHSGTNTFSAAVTYNAQVAAAFSAPTISAGALTLNLANGPIFNVANNANATSITISNAVASKAGSFAIYATADGTLRTWTWPASVKWSGGVAPTFSSTNGYIDRIGCETPDGATTWVCAMTNLGVH